MVYEKAQAEIMEFDNTDVITTSGGSDPCKPLGYLPCSTGVGEEHYTEKDEISDME